MVKNNIVIIQWEYNEVFIGNGRAQEILNTWGAEGWELVSINSSTMYAYFKRRK